MRNGCFWLAPTTTRHLRTEALRYSGLVNMPRIAAAAVGALVIAAGLTACSAPQTPEEKYLDAIHNDSRITQQSTDEQWLKLGKSTCDVKEMLDPEILEESLKGNASEDLIPQILASNELALEYLCP